MSSRDSHKNVPLRLADLAERVGAELRGEPTTMVVGLATLAGARPDQVSFLANPRYLPDLAGTRAAAVILSDDLAGQCPVDCLVSAEPYVCFARASQLFAPAPETEGGIHPSSVVAESAQVHPDSSIGAGCVIGECVVIGRSARVGPGCVIGDRSSVGEASVLAANVTLYHDVHIGCGTRIHSGTVIGADGFGFAPSEDGWVKIAQLGGVRIGDNVEIGANCTIDRGALEDTLIGNGVILDNLVQVAHNVQIGENTAIAGCTGIAGSTKIGARCSIGGAVGIVGHLEITDGVHITAMSLVSGSIRKPGTYSSGTAMQHTSDWRRNAVRFKQLNRMHERLAVLEKSLQEVKEKCQ